MLDLTGKTKNFFKVYEVDVLCVNVCGHIFGIIK